MRNALAAALAAVALAACGSQEKAPPPDVPRAPEMPVAAQPYPLRTCVVMPDHELGDDAVTLHHDGREVRLCCKGCIAKFRADPKTYLAKLDAAAAAAK